MKTSQALNNYYKKMQTTYAANHVKFDDGIEGINLMGRWQYATPEDFIEFISNSLPSTVHYIKSYCSNKFFTPAVLSSLPASIDHLAMNFLLFEEELPNSNWFPKSIKSLDISMESRINDECFDNFLKFISSLPENIENVAVLLPSAFDIKYDLKRKNNVFGIDTSLLNDKEIDKIGEEILKEKCIKILSSISRSVKNIELNTSLYGSYFFSRDNKSNDDLLNIFLSLYKNRQNNSDKSKLENIAPINAARIFSFVDARGFGSAQTAALYLQELSKKHEDFEARTLASKSNCIQHSLAFIVEPMQKTEDLIQATSKKFNI